MWRRRSRAHCIHGRGPEGPVQQLPFRCPLPLRERAGVRGSAARQRGEMEPHDRRRVFAPRQPERRVRGAASIGTRGYLAGRARPTHPPFIFFLRGLRPHTPLPDRQPEHSPEGGPAPPRVEREPDCLRWPRWGVAPSPRPLPRGERGGRTAPGSSVRPRGFVVGSGLRRGPHPRPPPSRRGARRCALEGSEGGVGAQPPQREKSGGGWVGQSRAARSSGMGAWGAASLGTRGNLAGPPQGGGRRQPVAVTPSGSPSRSSQTLAICRPRSPVAS